MPPIFTCRLRERGARSHKLAQKTAKLNARFPKRMEIAGGVQIQFPQIYPGAGINVFYCAAPRGFIQPVPYTCLFKRSLCVEGDRDESRKIIVFLSFSLPFSPLFFLVRRARDKPALCSRDPASAALLHSTGRALLKVEQENRIESCRGKGEEERLSLLKDSAGLFFGSESSCVLDREDGNCDSTLLLAHIFRDVAVLCTENYVIVVYAAARSGFRALFCRTVRLPTLNRTRKTFFPAQFLHARL